MKSSLFFEGITYSANKKTQSTTPRSGNEEESILYPELSEQNENGKQSSTDSYKTKATEIPLMGLDDKYPKKIKKDIIEGVTKANANERKDVPPDELAYLSVWDFAGQEVFYDTHHLFLNDDGIYIFVFNLEEWKDAKGNHRLKGQSKYITLENSKCSPIFILLRFFYQLQIIFLSGLNSPSSNVYYNILFYYVYSFLM